MRFLMMLAAAVVLLGHSAGPARAQAPLRPGGIAPNTRPTFSPYLNLLRRGNSPAFNYYGLVRPEMRAINSINTLSGEVAANRELIATGQGGGGAGTLTTGHSAMFLNTGGYFLNMSGGAGPTRGPAASRGGVGAGAAGGKAARPGKR